MLGYRLVCRQHEVLNHLRGHISLIGKDLHRSPLFIQMNLRLGEIKIQRSPRCPSLSNQRRKFPHHFKHRHQIPIFFRLLGIVIFENFLYGSVTHSSIYPYHCLGDLIVCHFPGRIQRHDTAECQPVLPLVQRTDTVGERMGQHGNNPIHQIHAGTPLKGLHVQRASLPHIVGNIGYMNAENVIFPLAAQ